MLLTGIRHDKQLIRQRIEGQRKELALQTELLQLRARETTGKLRTIFGRTRQAKGILSPSLAIVRFIRGRRQRREAPKWRRWLAYVNFGRAIANLVKAIRQRRQAAA